MYRTSYTDFKLKLPPHVLTGNSHWSEIIKQQQVTSKLLSPPLPRALEPTRIHANNINFYLIGKYHSLVSPTALLLLFFCFSRLTVCMESWLYLISKKRACQFSLLGLRRLVCDADSRSHEECHALSSSSFSRRGDWVFINSKYEWLSLSPFSRNWAKRYKNKVVTLELVCVVFTLKPVHYFHELWQGD